MASVLRKMRTSFMKPAAPRRFSSTGFTVVGASQVLEEEEWEWYGPQEFYPVRIGEVFKSQYQVVGKLGYGANGTAWLCRDLLKQKHVMLKVGNSKAVEGELRILRHLAGIKTNHAGSQLVRQMLDDFEIRSEEGVFHGITHEPLAISLHAFRKMLPDRKLPIGLLKSVLRHLLLSLDFLHTEAGVIHTGDGFTKPNDRTSVTEMLDFLDIQEKNILLGMNVATAQKDLDDFEETEIKSLSPRKIDGERIVYQSRPLVPPIYSYGRPVLSDFGEARLRGGYDGLIDIQPYQYRAPEVIFDISWNEKVDIWSVGAMMCDLLGDRNLFKTTGGAGETQDNIYHLANMIALLGPPPKDLLDRTEGERVWEWFDKSGEWRGLAEIPNETLDSKLQSATNQSDQRLLLFMRRILKWKPEERSSAKELLDDVWLSNNGD